jgi:glutamate/tyrosine decarboxylase-like PLP-dependent enzyme
MSLSADCEVPSCSNHSPREVEHALSAFFKPENSNFDAETLISFLMWIGLGDGYGNPNTDEQCIKDGIDSILGELKGVREFSPTYLGHMVSEASIPGLLGYILALRIGSNTVAREVSLQESILEPQGIRGLMRIVGYDPEVASGTFTSGGTMANFTALAVARELLSERIPRLEKPAIVLGTRMCHYSIPKSINLLAGPNSDIRLKYVETESLKMSRRDLAAQMETARVEHVPVMAVVAIAGETETGLVDYLADIADIAEAYDHPFLIADGAYGAPYRLSRAGALFTGLERYDAITIDSHKALYTPYSNGAILFKQAESHARLNRGVEADYLHFATQLPEILDHLHKGKGNLGEKRVEGSMGAGPILSTLAVLRTLGIDGLSIIYDLSLDRINYLYNRVSASPYFVPLHKPELNLLCFTLNERTRERLAFPSEEDFKRFIARSRMEIDHYFSGSSGYYFSDTSLPLDDGSKMPAWRACIMHPRTTDQIVETAMCQLEEFVTRESHKKGE